MKNRATVKLKQKRVNTYLRERRNQRTKKRNKTTYTAKKKQYF